MSVQSESAADHVLVDVLADGDAEVGESRESLTRETERVPEESCGRTDGNSN